MEAKDYAYEIVAQLGYSGKLDERITTEQAQQIIETALDNYVELRLSNVVGQSEQLRFCSCKKPSPDIMYGKTCVECCLEIDPKA